MPGQIATLPVGAYPECVVALGSYVYILDSSEDILYVVDVSTPSSPMLVGTGSTGTISQTVANLEVAGDFACVTDNFKNQLRVIDVRDETNPILVDSISIGSTPVGLDVNNNLKVNATIKIKKIK